MSELERKVGEAVRSASAAYEPSADLPVRIEGRVRFRRRRARALAGGGALAVTAIIALVVTQMPSDDQQGVVANDPTATSSTSTTTTMATTTTTTMATTTTTTTAAPPTPTLTAATPLSAKGIGPIEAGMTVAEAEAASGLSLEADGSFTDFGGHCFYVELEGNPDLAIRVHSPDGQPVADAGDGVISAITIYVEHPAGTSARQTTAGIGLGASEAEVRAAHGDAVEERPHDYVPEGAYLYVHPNDAPGYGFRYVLDERRVVTSIDVGDSGGITASEGCA